MIQPQPIRPVPDDEPERPEEGQMRGILPIRIGSETRYVPTLKRARSRAWKQEVVRATASIDLPDVDTVELLEQAAVLTDDLVFALVLSFDHTDVLGGREYLDENADDRDILDAFEAMMRSASPKGDDLYGGFISQVNLYLSLAWARRTELRREQSASGKPTSGSPAPTDGTPNRSMRRSRTSSTSSSGTTAKKPRTAKPRTDAT